MKYSSQAQQCLPAHVVLLADRELAGRAALAQQGWVLDAQTQFFKVDSCLEHILVCNLCTFGLSPTKLLICNVNLHCNMASEWREKLTCSSRQASRLPLYVYHAC